jgi:hypothetical protein
MSDMLFEPFETYYTRGLLYKHLTEPKFDYFNQVSNPIIRRHFWKKWQEHPSKQTFWIALTRRFKKIDDMRDHFLSVMVTRSPKEYGNLYDLECYQKWVGRLHTMHVQFEDDLTVIRRRAGSLKKSIRGDSDAQPMLYTLLMSGQISMETFAWLVHFQPKIITVMDAYFDQLDLAWKEKRMVAIKYAAFLTRLNINQERLKTILKGYIA